MSGGGQLLPRRHWLIATARYATLGGVGLLVWKLIARPGQICLRATSPCQECQLLARCSLPKAQQERDKTGVES